MKGTTHLAIGCALGAVACAYYPFSWSNASLYMSVAAFSALSADLDGPSLLSGKITKLSKRLRNVAAVAGISLPAIIAYLYFANGFFKPSYVAIAIAALLIGLVAKQGAIRNALVSLIGGFLAYGGWAYGQSWLIGLGAFVVVAPWLKHRGLTHTVWAVVAWGAIAQGLEKQLGVDGLSAVAVAGYVSHLLADTMTPSGVKWIYPIYKKSIKLR